MDLSAQLQRKKKPLYKKPALLWKASGPMLSPGPKEDAGARWLVPGAGATERLCVRVFTSSLNRKRWALQFHNSARLEDSYPQLKCWVRGPHLRPTTLLIKDSRRYTGANGCMIDDTGVQNGSTMGAFTATVPFINTGLFKHTSKRIFLFRKLD